MEEIMNIYQAAAFLGRGHRTMRRLIHAGILTAYVDGTAYMFRRSDLEKFKNEQYPQGMTHGDIAHIYNVKRTTVIEQFRRLAVKSTGVNRGKSNATVYSHATVAKFAEILGWERRHKNPTDEPALPSSGMLPLDGEP